jgi:hypothetical protein
MTPLQLTTTVFPIAYQVFEGWKDGCDDGDFSAWSNTSHSGDGDGDDSWYYSFDLSEN